MINNVGSHARINRSGENKKLGSFVILDTFLINKIFKFDYET